jgi:SPW repeat
MKQSVTVAKIGLPADGIENWRDTAPMGLAAHWWFWVLAAALGACSLALSRRYPALVLRVRRFALRRRLVTLEPGQALRAPSSAGHDPSWLVLPLALWLGASPWIWGYDGEPGAIASDLVTAAVVLLLGLAAIVLPALWALETLAGLWLVVAPWLVGFGDANGPVGLSDVACGVLLTAVAIAALVAAQRQLTRGSSAVGRLRR